MTPEIEATKACAGWDQGKCANEAQIPNVTRYKRCSECSKLQHRLVVNASYRRNWPRYRKNWKEKRAIRDAAARAIAKAKPKPKVKRAPKPKPKKPINLKGRPRLAALLRTAEELGLRESA
jgi:hypothetical protein